MSQRLRRLRDVADDGVVQPGEAVAAVIFVALVLWGLGLLIG